MYDVEAGSTLAEALRKQPCFSDLFVNMVEAGEAGGILDVILNRLAVYLEKADALMKKVKGAMTYPAVVLHRLHRRVDLHAHLHHSDLRRRCSRISAESCRCRRRSSWG